ncbi:nuclear transport factor 2 family protein [Mannheimia massilioguelmaensis]|uniref:nuclear transport factor 2 family protein n=1 Tax=Mannheimia massilioguelmaensis TaxID=1604354 RepID=UPI0005C80ABF|nr:nuclear transport factor 2 family protein [Mannheimia massilioguelmaensis]
MVTRTEDYQGIVAAVNDYAAGQNGDMVRLKNAFYPEAMINGQPIEALYQTVERKGKTDSTIRIDSVDITGYAAIAKVVTENWHGARFVEYMSLLKSETGWRIIAKTFSPF